MSFNPNKICRGHINSLFMVADRTSTVSDGAEVLLNANENPLGSVTAKWYNRFPFKDDETLIEAISAVKLIDSYNILPGNGNHQCLDWLVRCFCEPGISQVIICQPCNAVYATVAHLNNIAVKNAPMLSGFQLDLVHLESLVDEQTTIIFIGSPNDPTGNAMRREDVEMILNNFAGIVVIDETYINFSRQKSFVTELSDYPNLVVLQNFDIAWGLAGLQVSMLLASKDIIQIVKTITPPYNINTPTRQILLKALEEVGMVNDMIKELVQMRAAVKRILEKFPFVEMVYPSDANFLLVKVSDAKKLCGFLLHKGILVTDVSSYQQCDNCLRITTGTEDENTRLVEALVQYFDEEDNKGLVDEPI